MKDLSIKKLYYSISEVSKITEVEQYVLRYWETEFDLLKPQKNRAGNRIYTNKDIQLILNIKSLLRDKKYTIEGAKNILLSLENEDAEAYFKSLEENNSANKAKQENAEIKNENNPIRNDLKEIKEILEILIEKL
jgi:DNA-binding transcriptional MerR regulator